MSQRTKHPSPPDTPFADPNPYQDWVKRKSQEVVPYDIVILAKDGYAAYDRLFVEHQAEFAVSTQPTGHVFFRLKDGRFAVVTPDDTNLDEMWPGLEVWNWWDESEPDLATLREKALLDEKISGVRYH